MPFEVHVIDGSDYSPYVIAEDPSSKESLVRRKAEVIQDIHEHVAERQGRIVGSHVLQLVNSNVNAIDASVLFLVAEIPDHPKGGLTLA